MGTTAERNHHEDGREGRLLEVRAPEHEESRRRVAGIFDPLGTLGDEEIDPLDNPHLWAEALGDHADYAGGLGETVIDITDFTVLETGESFVRDWCGYCTSKQTFTESGKVRTCHGCNQTFTVSRSPDNQALFEAARKLNPKRIRSSGKPADIVRAGRGLRCATVDCLLPATTDSIFCVGCDNERMRPVTHSATQRVASGSVTEEIARRRKAIQDHKLGIGKAVL